MAYPQFSIYQGPSGPACVGASGTLTAAVTGVVCRLQAPRARFYTITFNGLNVGTANLAVQAQILDVTTGNYINASTTFQGLAGNLAVTVTLGTAVLMQLYGPLDGIQLFIPAWGTSTGSFTGVITAL